METEIMDMHAEGQRRSPDHDWARVFVKSLHYSVGVKDVPRRARANLLLGRHPRALEERL